MLVETKTIETPYGSEELCAKCGSDVAWVGCWNCTAGYTHHECGDDCCACLAPQLNVKCDVCNGNGGWFECWSCNQNKPEVNQSHNNQKNKPSEVKPNSSQE